MHGRSTLWRLVAAWILALAGSLAHADTYPARPVQLLVGFSAGSGTDLVARRLAEGLGKVLGTTVVVVNLPGAGSTLAAARAAQAVPDGHTVYLADFSHAIAPGLYPSLPYDTVGDFKGVAPVSRFDFALAASQKSGLANAQQLMAAARGQPGGLGYGSSGNGSALHLIGEVFASRVQARFLHVPYRGGGDVLNALLAGDIDFAFFPVPPLLVHARSGKLQIVGVPGAVRDPKLPDVPTLREQGVQGFDAFTWNILLAPAATPDPVVERLASAVAQVTRSTDFREGISSLGAHPLAALSPVQTRQFLAEEVRAWGPVVKSSGAKVE